MGKNLWRAGVCVAVLTLAAIGCSGSSKKDADPGSTSSTTCTAGASRCDGLNVKVCSADGTSESIESTCSPAESCSDGECRATACVPNTKFCKERAVWKCDSTGGGSTLSQTCASGLYCLETDEDASCSAQACSANQPLCDGSIATTCQADGSGPKPGGTDCKGSSQACYQGQCRDVSCVSGMKVCQHDDVYLCAQNGTDISLLADCRDDEVCDGNLGACRTKACDPGKVSCDGTRVATCNEFGSGWLTSGTDCAASSSVCINGTCRKQVCTPNYSFCNEGSVYSCDSTGTSATLSETCNPQWYRCSSYTTYAYCTSYQCTPNETFCDGNTIKTCTADGSLPGTGTVCAQDEYCSNATCKPRGCTLDQYTCKNGDIYYCGNEGSTLVDDCGDEKACQATNDGAICVALPCEPGATVCLGNKVGTCASDGQTLSKVTEDCTATVGNICSAELKCAKTSVDTLGVAENVEPIYSSMFIGNVIDVTSARKLTEISLNLVLAAPRELRWVVYEQTGQVFTARIDKVVSNVTGAGFATSGAISYSLKAGKRYLFGAVISGGDSVAYFDSAPFSRKLSFGTIAGRISAQYQSTYESGYLTAEYVYQARATTEAP